MIANIYWIVDKITAYKKTETPLCYSRSFCFFVIKNNCGGTFVIGKKCKYAADIVVLKKHGYDMIAGIFSAFYPIGNTAQRPLNDFVLNLLAYFPSSCT